MGNSRLTEYQQGVVDYVRGLDSIALNVPTQHGAHLYVDEVKTMSNEARIQREVAIMRRLVRAGLEAGYAISVFDGEEWPVKRSHGEAEVMAWAHEVDELRLRFTKPGTTHITHIGTALLIFGNDEDLISDYTATAEMDRLVSTVYADIEGQSPASQVGGLEP